jgi:pyruvate dehydrogenase E1 component beta subunit
MSEDKLSFVEAINQAHFKGLKNNKKSLVLGLGVDYENGADGTTSGLSSKFKKRVLDVPVSEAAFTGMSVGMATQGLNPIVHHGRIEFALLAMDSILTQAAKWDFMFGGEYNCSIGLRINLGRQWGNGPQHTAAYTSLFANTPGLNVLWPSTPKEAFDFCYFLHFCKSPTIMMEHRYIFQTKENLNLKNQLSLDRVQTFSIYGKKNKITILTYGDGLVEALKVKDFLKNSGIDICVICMTGIINKREIPNQVINLINESKNLLVLDTSNYNFGVMQGLLGQLLLKINNRPKITVFSPPFEPCPTSPKLVGEYYPFAPKLINFLRKVEPKLPAMKKYTFDELHLPAQMDYTKYKPKRIYQFIK